MKIQENYSKSYNIFVSILIFIGAYSIISPYLLGGVYDLDNQLFSIIVGVFSLWFLFRQNLFLSSKTILALLMVFFAWFNILLSSPAVSFAYFTKCIVFSVSILLYCIVLLNVEEISVFNLNLMFAVAVLQTAIYFIKSFDNQYYVTMWSGTYLQLAFDNKNATAMQLLFTGCLLTLFLWRFLDKKKYFLAILSGLCIGVLLYLIYLTGSRSSLVAMLFVIPFIFFDKLGKILNSKTILLMSLFPLIFASVCVWLYKSNFVDVSFLGRRIFNGRELMWISVFDGFPQKWILGMYSEFVKVNSKNAFQLHNGLVDMIGSYGAIVTGMFVYLMNFILNKYNSIGSKMNTLIVVCVLAIVIQSTGEAAAMIGNRSIFIAQLFMLFQIGKADKAA